QFPTRPRPRAVPRTRPQARARARRPRGPSSACRSGARARRRRARPCRRPASLDGCGLSLAIPRDRPGEPLVELDLRLPPEQLARLLDVRDAQLDVRVVERLEDELAG